MREIKFRGLSAKGEMVYGSLSPDLPNSTMYYKDYSQRICWFPESGGQANAPVKNGTVGQCTGLKDKNGVEIYEGDVVTVRDYDDGDCYMTGSIKYGVNGYPAFDIYDRKGGTYSDEYNTLSNDGLCFEIIGNIHEKPELLSC